MTGIERLRKLSEDVGYTSLWSMLLSGREDDWDCEEYDDKTLDGTLTAIADQIEREREELEKRLMPEGCDWEFLKLHMSNLRGFMLDVIDRLGVDKSDSDAPEIVFDALDRRLMPEGVEWPRYDTGEPVRIGGTIADELGHAHEVESVEIFDDAEALHWSPSEPEEFVWLVHGARVRRPADTKPKPPDSWERIEKDAGKDACMYFCHSDVPQPPNCGHDVRSCRVDMAEDLVRRCEALAERERNE